MSVPRQDMDFQHHMNYVVTFNELLTITVYALINTKHYTMTQRKSTTKSYDQQKENYTLTQRKSTTKKL